MCPESRDRSPNPSDLLDQLNLAGSQPVIAGYRRTFPYAGGPTHRSMTIHQLRVRSQPPLLDAPATGGMEVDSAVVPVEPTERAEVILAQPAREGRSAAQELHELRIAERRRSSM